MIEVMEMREVEKIPVPYDEFVDLIRAKEKLENIKKLYERCGYPVDEVKALLDIEEKKNESRTD